MVLFTPENTSESSMYTKKKDRMFFRLRAEIRDTVKEKDKGKATVLEYKPFIDEEAIACDETNPKRQLECSS